MQGTNRIDDCHHHDFDDVKGVRPFVSTLRYGSYSDPLPLCQCHEGQHFVGLGEEKGLEEKRESRSSATNHEGSAEKENGQK